MSGKRDMYVESEPDLSKTGSAAAIVVSWFQLTRRTVGLREFFVSGGHGWVVVDSLRSRTASRRRSYVHYHHEDSSY